MEKYPTFQRGEVKEYYEKLQPSEKKLIDGFVNYVKITSNSKCRIENNRRSITEFRIVTEKDLNKVTLEDLRHFLAVLNSSNKTQGTRNDLKHSIKRFLRWHFKDWSKRFNELSDIKLVSGINEEKINADTLLKKEEIENIMKAETRFRWKTFFITLYESGLRPIELRSLRWKNIKLEADGDLSEIAIYATKTSKARTVFVKEATKYLKELRQRQESQELKNDLLFPAARNPDVPIGKNVVSEWFRELTKRAIGREVHPYILRHTRATELYTNVGIPDKTVQKFLGHTKSMSDVYTHLSNNDIREALSKTIYRMNDLPPDKKHRLEKDVEEMQTKLDAQELMNKRFEEMEKRMGQLLQGKAHVILETEEQMLNNYIEVAKLRKDKRTEIQLKADFEKEVLPHCTKVKETPPTYMVPVIRV